MKKHLPKLYKFFLIFLSLFFITKLACFAYETVIINFPENEGWHLVYSHQAENEVIVQFMPKDETRNYWRRTVVFHSYPHAKIRNINALKMQQRMLADVRRKNSSFEYRNLRTREGETLGIWCVKKNEKMDGQCEILRTVQGYETVVSMHYINKNINSLKDVEKDWINIIRDVRNYYSYYRNDRMLNRETIFEF